MGTNARVAPLYLQCFYVQNVHVFNKEQMKEWREKQEKFQLIFCTPRMHAPCELESQQTLYCTVPGSATSQSHGCVMVSRHNQGRDLGRLLRDSVARNLMTATGCAQVIPTLQIGNIG